MYLAIFNTLIIRKAAVSSAILLATALGAAANANAGTVSLEVDTLLTESLGYKFNGNLDHRESLTIQFERHSGDLTLSLTGFDIDTRSEVSVLLNGVAIGELAKTPNNGFSPTTFSLPEAALVAGTNNITLNQSNPGWIWGVTDILLTSSTPVVDTTSDVQLIVGEIESGDFGYRYNGVVAHRESLTMEFERSNGDLTLSLTAYDIDTRSEVSVLLNGVAVGELAKTPNNGFSPSTFDLPETALVTGSNIITLNPSNPGWTWGATDILLTSSTPVIDTTSDVQLIVGEVESGDFGYRFNGVDAHRESLTMEFESNSENLTLSLTGYDIDTRREVSVLLNGVAVGDIARTPNNGFSPSTFDLPETALVTGTNIITLTPSNPGWKWGVTDILLLSDDPIVVTPPVNAPNLNEPGDLFQRDGYNPIGVLRVDLRTATVAGQCDAEDESGCVLADVMADIDKFDDHTVDINVHFQSDDFADDGSISNAELRLRGGGSRFAEQKSFRIKLDSKTEIWRGERHMQLNKHPFESSRIRNKLAMDIMSEIPNLPSVRTQFVNLWIDDGEGPVDYGLFTHVERVNGNFLRQREWNDDDRIYKAAHFHFDKYDLGAFRLDEDGEPLDEDLFERILEIDNGDDHRTLLAMMNALHNPGRSFESVLEQYFDRDNVLAWVSANILLRQQDSVRQNFILRNPVGSDKFYFIPWDYDETLGPWIEPPNDLSNDSLRQRLEYGYALAARNVFLENLYRLPGIHDEILETVQSLRQNYVTDQSVAEKANAYINISEPFQKRTPDITNNPHFTTFSAVNFIRTPGENEEALRLRFGVLMAPILEEPTLSGDVWNFSWQPAHDVTGTAGTVRYRLQVATSPTFNADSITVDIGAIDDAADVVVQNVDAAQLPVGEYFARLIATPANEPERNWQVSGNKLYFNNTVYFGTLRFEVE